MTTHKTVLVTGAGGFVGRHLCDTLEGRGHVVRRIQRSGAEENVWLIDDLATSDIPEEAFAKVDLLIHLAARMPGRKGSSERSDTAAMADRVARRAQVFGVERVVHLSSIAARLAKEGDGGARDYGVQKLEAEQAFDRHLGSATRLVTLRPPVIYGPGAKGSFASLQTLVRKAPVLPFGRATEARCYLSVGNLCTLILALAEASNVQWQTADRGIFEPNDGSPISTRELSLMLAEKLGVAPRMINTPKPLLKFVGRATGKQDQVDAIFEPLLCRDSPSLQAAFGWQPNETFPESLNWLQY